MVGFFFGSLVVVFCVLDIFVCFGKVFGVLMGEL